VNKYLIGISFLVITEPEDTLAFSGNGTHKDFFRIFVRDGKHLLVGGRY